MVKISLPFFKKKEDKKMKTEPSKTKKETPSEEIPFIYTGDIIRYKTKPNLIFIGSGKGGVGKSLIASNLTVLISALSNNDVYAVDLDLDLSTLSNILVTPYYYAKLAERIKGKNVEYVNLASILINATIKGNIIPIVNHTIFACNDRQIPVKYRIIPTYNVLTRREQEGYIRSVTPQILLKGLRELVTFFREKAEEQKKNNRHLVAIFDGKQKSNIGLDYEPLYRLMIDQADVFIYPIEPPYLSFNEIMSQYRNAIEKTILVVNKATPEVKDKLQVLITDAVDRGIPIFIIPYSSEDRDTVTKSYSSPALHGLKRPTVMHTAPIAYFLNLLDDTLIQELGCTYIYDLMKYYSTLMKR